MKTRRTTMATEIRLKKEVSQEKEWGGGGEGGEEERESVHWPLAVRRITTLRLSGWTCGRAAATRVHDCSPLLGITHDWQLLQADEMHERILYTTHQPSGRQRLRLVVADALMSSAVLLWHLILVFVCSLFAEWLKGLSLCLSLVLLCVMRWWRVLKRATLQMTYIGRCFSFWRTFWEWHLKILVPSLF